MTRRPPVVDMGRWIANDVPAPSTASAFSRWAVARYSMQLPHPVYCRAPGSLTVLPL